MTPASALPAPADSTAVAASASLPIIEGTRLPGLDGVRGLACLFVVLNHAFVPGFQAGGMAGVHVFFVLSGFLITGLLLSEFASNGRIDLVAFWQRRALRLLPALWLFVVVTCLVFWAAGWESATQLGAGALPTLLYYANFVPRPELVPFVHTWTLALEEQFYLTWPVVLFGLLLAVRRFGERRRYALVLAAVLGLTLLSAWWRLYDGDNATVPSLPHTTAFALLAGAALAVARHHGWVALRRPAFVAALIAAPAVLWGHIPAKAWGLPGDWVHLGLLQVALAVVLVAAACAPGGTLVHLAVLRRLGDVSYGWYLWHYPMLEVATRGDLLGGHVVASRVVVVLGSLGVAVLSWRYLERPLLRRYRSRLERSRFT